MVKQICKIFLIICPYLTPKQQLNLQKKCDENHDRGVRASAVVAALTVSSLLFPVSAQEYQWGVRTSLPSFNYLKL
jgi:hypothetical protein